MKKGTCRLCCVEGELCRSHILPEFVYKPVYATGHRLHGLTTRADRSHTTIYKGFREHLLCRSCEFELKSYEDAFRKMFFGTASTFDVSHWRQTVGRNGTVFTVPRVDLHALRKFQLSILWRASVATHEFFSQVALGPYEERARNLISDAAPISWDEFPCVMSALVQSGELNVGLVMQPVPRKVDGAKAYQFIFAGIEWNFFVGKKESVPRWLHDLCSIQNSIQRSRSDYLLPAQSVVSSKTIRSWYGKLASMGRLDDANRRMNS